MKESLNWCTTEHYLSDYCLMMVVNLVIPNELKTFTEAWHHPNPMQWEIGRKQSGRNFPPQ